MGGFCENSPSQYTPRPGTVTARNISGIAAEASRHSTHSSCAREQLEVPAQDLDRADLEQRRAGLRASCRSSSKSKDAFSMARKWSSPQVGRL